MGGIYIKIAILVDGGFYRRRAQSMIGELSAEERANELYEYCLRHIKIKREPSNILHRILYYDCAPSAKKVYHPLLKRQIDLGRSDLFAWTNAFFDELKRKRKFALRLGMLNDEQSHYSIRYDILKKLCNGAMSFDQLREADFALSLDQKGVDMKIGLDIATMAYKKQVDRIVLISGDSDFIPAAKLARREGIDFILDPLYNHIKPELAEHVDGIFTCDKRFNPDCKNTNIMHNAEFDAR